MLFRRRKKSTEDAQAALEDACKNLKQVEQRSDEVSRVSEAIKQVGERNHFAEQLEEIVLHLRHRGSFE